MIKINIELNHAHFQVNLFVDNLAVCNSDKSYFIKAFSKHEITEENKLQTVVPATGSNTNCTFAISHQHPIGGKYNIIIYLYMDKF